jgi:uncharacterized protein (TIGR02246 family)
MSEHNGEKAAVLAALRRAGTAWDDNDADAFADGFVENGSILFDDDQLTDQDAIRDYLHDAFAGRFGGTRLLHDPIEFKVITPDVAVVITEGGVLPAGETELGKYGAVRATWVSVRHDGQWRLFSQQTSPVAG